MFILGNILEQATNGGRVYTDLYTVRVLVEIYEQFECAVIDRCEISDWFKIKSGVK